MDAVATLERAIAIISREMSKNPALLQKRVELGNMNKLFQTLNAVIDAASFSLTDKKKLTALVQAQQAEKDEDDDEETSAPAAVAYKSKSGSIIDILEDMKEKAEEQ